jgi:hypothetical protein
VYRPLVLDQLSDAALGLLASTAVASVATLEPGGGPHVSVAWIDRRRADRPA